MSDLEVLVTRDMVDNGFDPNCIVDVKRYWNERLS